MGVFTGELILRPGDRLYTPIWQLMQLVISVVVAGHSASQNRRVATGNSIHRSAQFNTDVLIPIDGVIEHAFSDVKPALIQLKIGLLNFPTEPPNTGRTSDWSALRTLISSVIFVNLYEAHKPWIDDTYKNDLTKWPPVWNFARVVRNAIAHSGNLYFKDPKTSAGAEWHHIKYEANRHGDKIIDQELFFPEMVLLMIEMGQALDAVSAPILT